MVKLTQIEDEQEATFQEQQANASTNAPVVEEDFEEDSESDSDDEDEFDEDETIYERIVALKDIVPPKQRTQISGFINGTYSTIYSGVSKAGNLTWYLTTSALLLGVPLSLSILAEQQLMELEKEFKLQQGSGDILASPVEGAAVPAATA